MKKIILLIAIASSGILNCRAQFMFGPQAGLNVATLSGTALSVSSKPGLHAGIFFSIPLTNHFSIVPAALYSMKGFKYDYSTSTTNTVPDTSGGNISTTVTVNGNVDAVLGYLDIPAMITYWSGDNTGFFIQAGPQLSFLITDKADVSSTATLSVNGGASQPTTPESSNTLRFNKTDVALIGGIGYKFPLLLLVYARASTGFLKVQQDGFVKDSDAGNNFVIEAGAALTFGAK